MTEYRFNKHFKKTEDRVWRAFEKNKDKIKRVLIDDNGNVFKPKRVSMASNLHMVDYVVIGNKVYYLILTADFTREVGVKRYKKTILASIPQEFGGIGYYEEDVYGLSGFAEFIDAVKGLLK